MDETNRTSEELLRDLETGTGSFAPSARTPTPEERLNAIYVRFDLSGGDEMAARTRAGATRIARRQLERHERATLSIILEAFGLEDLEADLAARGAAAEPWRFKGSEIPDNGAESASRSIEEWHRTESPFGWGPTDRKLEADAERPTEERLRGIVREEIERHDADAAARATPAGEWDQSTWACGACSVDRTYRCSLSTGHDGKHRAIVDGICQAKWARQ